MILLLDNNRLHHNIAGAVVIQTGPPRPEISQTAELDSSTYTSLGFAQEFLTVVQFRSSGGAEDDLRSDATSQQSATTL
jgi:hypothetical protein